MEEVFLAARFKMGDMRDLKVDPMSHGLEHNVTKLVRIVMGMYPVQIRSKKNQPKGKCERRRDDTSDPQEPSAKQQQQQQQQQIYIHFL